MALARVELKNPRKTFINASVILIVLTFLNTAIPLMVYISLDSNLENYVAGYFTVMADEMAPWLGNFFTIGAIISFMGLYSSQVSNFESNGNCV